MQHLDLSTPEAQEAYEHQAHLFAKITHTARDMVPLLTQEFEVRMKSGNDENIGYCFNSKSSVKRLGKTLKVKVYWINRMFFTLGVIDTNELMQFDEQEFRKYVTQKGVVLKMFNLWKLHREIINK